MGIEISTTKMQTEKHMIRINQTEYPGTVGELQKPQWTHREVIKTEENQREEVSSGTVMTEDFFKLKSNIKSQLKEMQRINTKNIHIRNVTFKLQKTKGQFIK